MDEESVTIPYCGDHPGAMPEDGWEQCDGCVAEKQATEHLIDGLIHEANTRLQGLNQSGQMIDPMMPMAVRLDVLVQALFREPRSRLGFEAEVARRTVDVLKGMQANASPLLVPNGGKDKRLHVVRGKN